MKYFLLFSFLCFFLFYLLIFLHLRKIPLLFTLFTLPFN